jgi:hypothetical protein
VEHAPFDEGADELSEARVGQRRGSWGGADAPQDKRIRNSGAVRRVETSEWTQKRKKGGEKRAGFKGGGATGLAQAVLLGLTRQLLSELLLPRLSRSANRDHVNPP